MSLREQLSAIFDAERKLREAESELLQAEPKELEALLTEAVREAKAESDPEESEVRLTRLADLVAQVPGAAMADALIAILDSEYPAVRVQAGDALLDVAYDRYADVARAIERALERREDGPAMQELPLIVAEIGEPSALTLISRFLQHENEEVVASGIEAITRLGDPQAIPTLQRLVKDPRVVIVKEDNDADDSEEGFTSTIGELASEAIDELTE